MKKFLLWLCLILIPLPLLADTEQEPGQPAKSTEPYPVFYPGADTKGPWASMAIGWFSLKNQYLPAGYTNLAIGYNALAGTLTTAGVQNLAIGYNACAKVTQGAQNTCIGSGAGSAITTGIANMLIGHNAGNNIGTGSYNIILDPGVGAGSSGTSTGTLQVLIGSGTSTNVVGTGATHVGYQAGKADTVAGNNTIIGSNVGLNNAGNGSAASNKIVLIGGNGTSAPLLDTASTSSNTLIGLGQGTPGTGDTMVGWGALNANTYDNANQVAFGFNALHSVNVAAAQNSAFGYSAGSSITMGTSNLCLGYNACSTTLSTGSGNIIIGSGADATASGAANQINIGGLLYYNNTSVAAPTVSSCGTGTPTIDTNANDKSGTVTAGTVATTCTITFASAYNTWNHCRVTAQSEGTVNAAYSYTKTAIIVTASTLGGAKIDYDCDGY